MSNIKYFSQPKIPSPLKEERVKYRINNIPTILDDSLNQLLLTASIKQPKRILEIGTATGMSGISLLNTLPFAKLTTIEKDEISFSEAKSNFEKYKMTDRVTQFLGDAGEILNFLDTKFDFIFLDGAKARYLDYMDELLRLLEIKGVLFADNVLFRGYVDGGVEFSHSNMTIVRNLREFINKMIDNEHLITQVYNIGDGILISQKIK